MVSSMTTPNTIHMECLSQRNGSKRNVNGIAGNRYCSNNL